MRDPRHIAAGILGAIDWQNELTGFCHCPGEALHTMRTGKKDCRVSLDGAPTIYCFHASCVAAVEEVNRRFRRELGATPWELQLPSGDVLRSGDVLQSNGCVISRAEAELGAKFAGEMPNEAVVLEMVRAKAERFKPELFEVFRWPVEQILQDSPLQVSERDPEDQFRTWLKLWPAHCHIWIGDLYSSGRPEHRTHFRPIPEWYQIGPALGNFTCGSAFKPGSHSRTNENLEGYRFMVIESDTLGKDQVGAVFAYLRRRLKYRLHCIIDTGGKSLHAWFDAPRNKLFEERLKAGLVVFGCDPKVFTYSQPVRVPGAWREGKLQKVIWLRDNT